MKGGVRESYGFPSFPSTTPLGNLFDAVAAGVESVLVGAPLTSRVSSAIFGIRCATKSKVCESLGKKPLRV